MIGQTISHYKILEKLGEGGMGMVYKAQDTKLGRFAALKFLLPELVTGGEERRRFIEEAKATSALDHPNIGTLYGTEETADGQMFMAMAYYEGVSLKKKLERGVLAVQQMLSIAVQITEGNFHLKVTSRGNQRQIISEKFSE